MRTSRLNLAKQEQGDVDWHTDLNDGFDDADARLLKVVAIGGSNDPNDNDGGNSEAADYVGQRLWDSTHFAWWTAKTAGASGVAEWVPDRVPGTVDMFSGAVGDIPDGWQLCDGSAVAITSTIGANVPDLSGRFIVGYDAGDSDYDAIGKTGGAKEVTLEDDEVPAVQDHSGNTGNDNSGTAGESGSGASASRSTHQHSMTHGHALAATAAQAHQNRPPFYTLAFMVKL